MYKVFVFTLISLVSAYWSFAGTKDSMQVIHYNIENGLPSNNIYSIIQDHNGYLWFATDNGAVKYNGYNFRVFNTNDSIPSNDVWKLYADSRNRIWIHVISNRLGYIQNDIYTKVHTNRGVKMITPADMCEAAGYIFFNYWDKGLALAAIDSNGTEIDFLSSKKYRFITIGMDTTLYFLVNDKALYSCKLKNNAFVFSKIHDTFPRLDSLFTSRPVANRKYIYCYRIRYNVISLVNIKTAQYREINIKDLGIPASEQLYMIFFPLLITDKNIYVLNDDFNVVEKKDLNAILPLPVQASSFFTDNFNNQWISTTTEGAWMYSKRHILRANPNLNLLQGSTFKGKANNGTTFWYNKATRKLFSVDSTMKVNVVGNFDDDINSIYPLDDSAVYIMFNIGKGIVLYNLYTRQATDFFKKDKPLFTKNYANEERLKNQLIHVPDKNKQLPLYNFFGIHHYAPDTKYMAGGSGIVVLKENKNNYVLEWLLSDRYTNIVYDSISDKYWFYNRENITLLNPVNNKTITFSKALYDLLKIHSFSNIKLDNYGNIYMLTDNKIVVFSTTKFQISFIPVNVDLSNAFFEMYNDKLLLAGKFGVGYATIINPFKISDFKYTANIRNYYYNRIQDMVVTKNGSIILNTDKAFYTIPINELADNNLLFSARDKYFMDLVVSTPEQKVVSKNDTFYLNGDTKKMSFDLINFYGSGNRSYSYKIDNNNWQESVSGDAFLPELEPGVYHNVKCLANDDVWKSKTYNFVIYIRPLWWQTQAWRIAFWLIGIILFIILFATVIILTRHYSAKASERKQANTELELRALYTQINPHFIFNTLSSAMFFISKNRFNEAYEHISKFSRLLRSYLKSSQERYIRLSEEIDMLRNYIELQQTRFENKFDYTIDIENKIPVNNIQIPSLLLQPLIENAINHGLFHKEEKGFLKLQFYQGDTNNELICIIEDNGIGREKAREIKKNSEVQYDSYGTKLTKQLIDIFKQYERMNIYLEYIDKEEPETGTIVKLTIKNIKYVA